MGKAIPDYQDADIILRLYEMRREAIMRESRKSITMEWWPRNYDEVLAITKPEHPMNAAFRQMATYWEMVYSLAKHGIVNADFLMETSGEGLFLYAKIAPHLEQLRKDYFPMVFQNAEWIATNSERGKMVFAMLSARVEQATKAQA
jgi:hypothetical protein